MKLHLHANFPYEVNVPNAALGYLKSALSNQNVEVTNVYWYLPPQEIFESIYKILMNFKKRISLFDPCTVLAAYVARSFYPHDMYKSTIIETILDSYSSLEDIKDVSKSFKAFVDYSLETKKMADVDVAGFTVKFYQWMLNRYIWCRLKAENPNITIVVGGLDTRKEAHIVMETFKEVDYAVWGAGEYPLQKLVNLYEDRTCLDEVPHLVYRRNNDVCSTDAFAPQVNYSFADHTDYFEQVTLDISPQIPIISTRSCKWDRCKFCNENKGVPYYERPLRDVIEEIEYQSKTYDVDRFIFLDADIGRKTDKDFKEFLKNLLISVKKRERPYEIVADISPQRLTRENTQLMADIRIGVQIGFEALTDSLLKKMCKMHSFAENIQALKVANDYNMDMYGLNVLRNLPEESEADVIESMKNVKLLRFFLNQNNLSLSELTLYKRAPYYREIPQVEREKRWVVNFLYDEVKRMGLIKEKNKWDFFGFRAQNLMHHQLWEEVADLLGRMESENITYSWVESSKGSVLCENNQVSGSKQYLLTKVETDILKFCDSIISLEELKSAFPQENIEEIVSQLTEAHLLYVDNRKRLISIPSASRITEK